MLYATARRHAHVANESRPRGLVSMSIVAKYEECISDFSGHRSHQGRFIRTDEEFMMASSVAQVLDRGSFRET